MKYAAVITVLFLLSVAGCHKNSDPVSASSTDTNPAFRIDTLRVTAQVQMDTIYHAPMTYIKMSLWYHFENRSGSLVSVDLVSETYGRLSSYSPMAPTPAGSIRSETELLKEPNTYAGKDSIFIRVNFKGAFWERNAAADTTYGAFDVKDSMWVHVAR